ncbi:hypothetical protein DFR70_11979 [Nocardia tenerifensis]|uniref:Uncharacterized protein n=1 Tax=Nocardia tenerifensis TaxID=228006 RepID=A0A318JQZ4_9NOCA|nr:hypothetical protein DFR70_11979 [Nocardia tenerifensis]
MQGPRLIEDDLRSPTAEFEALCSLSIKSIIDLVTKQPSMFQNCEYRLGSAGDALFRSARRAARVQFTVCRAGRGEKAGRIRDVEVASIPQRNMHTVDQRLTADDRVVIVHTTTIEASVCGAVRLALPLARCGLHFSTESSRPELS